MGKVESEEIYVFQKVYMKNMDSFQLQPKFSREQLYEFLHIIHVVGLMEAMNTTTLKEAHQQKRKRHQEQDNLVTDKVTLAPIHET